MTVLALHKLPNDPTLETFPSHLLQTICYDWFNQSANYTVKFCLVLGPSKLLFAAEVGVAPDYDSSAISGSYRSGLWERDVAELFIKEDHTRRYQEFNLSPAGAWWSCSFQDIRVADNANFKCPKGVETWAEVKENSWQAAMVIPRKELSIEINFEAASQANVCFIIASEKSPPGKSYFSYAKIPLETPDFHQPQYFEKLGIVGS